MCIAGTPKAAATILALPLARMPYLPAGVLVHAFVPKRSFGKPGSGGVGVTEPWRFRGVGNTSWLHRPQHPHLGLLDLKVHLAAAAQGITGPTYASNARIVHYLPYTRGGKGTTEIATEGPNNACEYRTAHEAATIHPCSRPSLGLRTDPREDMLMPPGSLHAYIPVPRAVVLARPLQQCQVAACRCPGTRTTAPRAAVLARPLQHCQVAAVCC